MAHFEAHGRLMDAIAPYFSVPKKGLKQWKAFVHSVDDLVATLWRQIVYETEKMCAIPADVDKLALKKFEDCCIDVITHVDTFESEIGHLARQFKCSRRCIIDEINMRALHRYPLTKMVCQYTKILRLAPLRVLTAYYIDELIEQDCLGFIESWAVMYDGCD